MAIRRLGQIFVDLGFITDDQLETLLEEQSQQPGQLLGKVAESQSLINEEQLAQALAEQFGMQVIHLADTVIPPNVLNLVNPLNFSGVLTSPFFGLPTSASNARRVVVGTRVWF